MAEEKRKSFPWSTLLASTFALLGVIVGSSLTAYLGVRAQIRVSNLQRRQQLYGELMGEKFVRAQVLVSRVEARVYSDYHEARWKRAGGPMGSLDLQEARRWEQKSEDLAFEVAKENRAFFQTLGMIRAVFPHTQKLDELVDRLYDYRAPGIKVPADAIPTEQLPAWKEKAVADLQRLVQQEYSDPTDDLLKYLRGQLRSGSD